MSIAQNNILALQTNAYFSEQVIEQINKRKNIELDVEFIETINDQLTTNIPKELSHIDFDLHNNIILFGFYDTELIKQIMHQMSKLSTLTIVEKNIDLIIHMFGTKDVSAILNDPRVILIAGEKEHIRNSITVRVTIRDFSYNLPRIKFIFSNYMKQHYSHYTQEIARYIISQASYIASSLGNDITDMLEGFEHSVENWLNLSRSLGVNFFKDRYKDIPAIIVSAGPSLDKNIEKLKQAYGKALILTVDTTFKKVLDLGIIPDSVSTMERPKNMYSIFYEDVEIPKDSVFIGPSVVTKRIIDEFDKFIFTGRKGEPPVRAMADALQYESLEIGLSCAHIPFAFANYVGANPIVFIGQDLAFSNKGETHFGEASNITKEGAAKQDLVEVEGNDGSKLTTNKFYYQFLLWFQEEIAKNQDKIFINATEGGAKIEGTILMTFEEVINKYCQDNVMHLSEMYEEANLQKKSNYEEQKAKINQFIKKLKEDCEYIISKLNQYQDKLVSLIDPISGNVDLFYAMRTELDTELTRNSVLGFLFQTITLKYNRSFNNYQSGISQGDWENLKYEGLRYYNLLQQVSEALIAKFDKYIDELSKSGKDKLTM